MLFIADIKLLADLAHSRGLPLIVDNTIATPVLTRPLEFGADVVVHSASKSLCGSGRIIGGCLISKNNIITKSTEPGLRENFADWVRKFPSRDFGPSFSPASAEKVIDELKTLKMRTKKHSENAMAVANFLESHPKISKVNYPGLESFPLHSLAKKYLKVVDEDINAYSYLMSFEIKGTIDDAEKVCDNLKIGHLATDLGKSSTIFIQPATTTHLQLGSEARKKAGVTDTMIRYSVGLEDVNDIIDDLEKSLSLI
jgi:O-acetylhomoserine/O-acetylserine sulfhydrylase-like pyridoxal-dependent enzyme